MKNDFSETLESIARALTEQNEAWSAARAVFEKLDGSSPVSVPAELFDEIEQASGPRTRGAQILSAFRA